MTSRQTAGAKQFPVRSLCSRSGRPCQVRGRKDGNRCHSSTEVRNNGHAKTASGKKTVAALPLNRIRKFTPGEKLPVA
jgi:hypothetical protein